jgi:GT2 family glycosyltransferase
MFTHVRQVDYVSGALLATPRATFNELGGLDTAYGFGYFDDVDYAFRVRQSGRTVYYQPESVIVHMEGGTAGVDVTRGAKRSQATNLELFRERWAEQLKNRPEPPMQFEDRVWLSLAYAADRLPKDPAQ